MNISLLQKIQETIQEHPERLDMSHLFKDGKKGVTVCIFGMAAALSVAPDNWMNLSEKDLWGLLPSGQNVGGSYSAHLLGLTDSAQKLALAYPWAWPKQFKEPYELANSATQKAEIACQRIQHLVTTGE